MDYTFFLTDVFTDRPFGGNQLAVLPDATGLTTETMQAVAREFNFSETTFVLPADDAAHHASGSRRMRIFTPRMELPFAGHPTVGTAAVLAAADGRKEATFVLWEGVGPVTVEVTGTYSRFTVHAPYETPEDASPPLGALAAALSLPEDAIEEAWYGGVGVRFCFVRLAGAEAVDGVEIDRAAWSAGLADGWAANPYVFAGDLRPGGRLHARSFPLSMGIEEDPATGAAATGLVAALAVRSPDPAAADPSLTIDQGVAMGRPSRIEATAHTRDGQLTGVSVGGHTVIVGRGTISL